jgi:hypothetical protein
MLEASVPARKAITPFKGSQASIMSFRETKKKKIRLVSTHVKVLLF